ncbi:arylsulfatase [Bradyrhizobium sp. CCGUVB23]|uniref:arylsulfatase n=1 Tax=Bradyrhizobium sp. CCGUVB23 TaxID=2949630 RepID=UPI0020B35826|nr:arylsulfatase [Bradyrhizobium sp. CCGUVB23]MCP3461480.1 arylsulfatase [Bradyrhizobium sp. CCGUVB23]
MSDDKISKNPESIELANGGLKRRDLLLSGSSLVAASALSAVGLTTPAQAQQPTTGPAPASAGQRPNIVFIMGDDIGWFNIGAYHQGIMASRTPNLDRLAAEGMRFTDYYAEASCTAGRANFITGELPIRTGLTTVGQAGSPIGMPAQAPTIATVLKSMGYTTGQFGKNHLGDLNEFLPTVHGFDEFFGYLYHLDAMEDPAHRNYPQSLLATVGPRNMVHSWATNVDDPSVQARWGKIGKQRIEDAGPLYPKRMETVDDEILQTTFAFIDKAKQDNKPFFVWLNPTRMHVVTHLSEKYENMRNSENGWSVSEGGFAQLDDIVGAVMKKLKDEGFDDNTIVAFTTDNGAENFTWPDGGQTPFAGGKGTALEGGFRVPCMIRWPGKVPAGKVENGIMSGLDWFPTFVAAAGNPNIADELRKGKQLGDKTYKVYLDGYNQTDLITGKGPSARHAIFYFTEGTLSAVRVDDFKYRFTDQPGGWLGGTVKVDWPILTNLRLDPFERTNLPNGDKGSLAFYNWFAYEFWRFQFVQQEVGKLAQTAIEFPPMQKGASFNLEAVKEQIEKAMQSHAGK